MDDREIIRLEQFRQLKKEIRGSEEHLIVGIDVALDSLIHPVGQEPRASFPLARVSYLFRE